MDIQAAIELLQQAGARLTAERGRIMFETTRECSDCRAVDGLCRQHQQTYDEIHTVMVKVARALFLIRGN